MVTVEEARVPHGHLEGLGFSHGHCKGGSQNSRGNASQVLDDPAYRVSLVHKVLLLCWEGDDGLPLLVTPT